MEQEYFRKVELIFLEAVKLQGDNRRAYLDQVCADNPELREEIESLLEADGTNLDLFAGSVVDVLVANGFDPAAELARNGEAASVGLRICRRGHTYDPALYRVCPRCGLVDLDIDAAGYGLRPPASGQSSPPTGRRAVTGPVVGWLVCVDGPEWGRDYPLRPGKNPIGRSTKMSVCLANDQAVYEECHAVLTYDPAGYVFQLFPGTTQGMTYLNGAVLQSPIQLRAHDTVEVGKSFLRFVPFCGGQFQWH